MTDVVDTFTEQGLHAFRVSDSIEWWVGRDWESVKAACLANWGGVSQDYWDSAADEEAAASWCDLDATQLCTGEPGDPDSKRVSFREYIRTMIAEGAEFPCFLCGTDY